MAESRERLREIRKTFEEVGKAAPDFVETFMKFKAQVEKEGALDKKTKKLIAIALSVATRCEWCVSMHVKEALDAGATSLEIMETCFVATLMDGAPSLMFAQHVIKAIDEFERK